MKPFFILLCLSLFGWPALAHGKPLTPEAAVREAIRANRDLATARYEITRAEARLVQAGLWSNPSFEAGVEQGYRGRDGQRLAGFMQRFPLAGRLEKARRLGRVDVAMAVAEYDDARRKLAGEVLGLARQGVAMQRREVVLKENRELLSTVAEQTTRLSATGQAGTSDALLARLELARLELDLGRLKVELAALHTRLNGLLGRQPGHPLRLVGGLPPVPSAEALRRAAAQAPTRRPDRRLALLRQGRAGAEETLAKARRWDDLGVGVDVMHEQGMETMIGLRVSLPLPLWDRQQGNIAEARAAQAQARAGVAAVDLAVATEVREAAGRLTTLHALLAEAGGPHRELAQENSLLLAATYATGETPFLTLFEGRRQELALRLAAVEIEEAYLAAYTDWEVRTGRVLRE